MGHCFIISFRIRNKQLKKERKLSKNAQVALAMPLLTFQLCQSETAFGFSRTVTSICGKEKISDMLFQWCHSCKSSQCPQKKKRDIIQFYWFHPRFLPPPPRSHFVPAFLSLPLISRLLSNVSPSCVPFPFAVSCGSLDPQLCVDLHFLMRSHSVWETPSWPHKFGFDKNL